MFILKISFLIILLNILIKWNSMISLLLTMEMLIISMMMCMWFFLFKPVSMIFFLFISVMEAVLGLSILVFMIREKSNELLNFF